MEGKRSRTSSKTRVPSVGIPEFLRKRVRNRKRERERQRKRRGGGQEAK